MQSQSQEEEWSEGMILTGLKGSEFGLINCACGVANDPRVGVGDRGGKLGLSSWPKLLWLLSKGLKLPVMPCPSWNACIELII